MTEIVALHVFGESKGWFNRGKLIVRSQGQLLVLDDCSEEVRGDPLTEDDLQALIGSGQAELFGPQPLNGATNCWLMHNSLNDELIELEDSDFLVHESPVWSVTDRKERLVVREREAAKSMRRKWEADALNRATKAFELAGENARKISVARTHWEQAEHHATLAFAFNPDDLSPATLAMLVLAERMLEGTAYWMEFAANQQSPGGSLPEQVRWCLGRLLSPPVKEVMTTEQDIWILKAARAAHNVNRAFCDVVGPPALTWEVTPEAHKQSVIAGVTAIYEDSSFTPEQVHENWAQIKLDEGWKYGPVKDETKKEHPCLVPYGDLPADQRYKNMLFAATVRGVLCSLGWDDTLTKEQEYALMLKHYRKGDAPKRHGHE